MEVVLKKTKITKSILKQTLRSMEIDLKCGDILGWCVFDGLRYIVCYRSETNGLSKFPMFTKIEELKGGVISLKLSNNNFTNYSSSIGGETPENFILLLKKTQHLAQVKGQFFI